MKKISVWKVILLSIVTLGIYAIVWFALRRNEFVKNYGQKLPHWLWLVIPIIVAIGLFIPFIILTMILVKDPSQATLVLTVGSLLLFLIPFAFSVWWVNRFGVAVAKLTGGRVPTVWTTLLYIFWGFAIVAVHQYYFNLYPVDKLPSEKNSLIGPSRKFVTLSSIAIAVSLVLTGYSVATFPAEYAQTQQEMIQAEQEATKDTGLLKEAEKLQADYQKCISKLESDFPGELLEENEASYNEAYNKCEEIRIKQWDAAEKYNKL